MKRILIGFIVVAVVAAGGWLGFSFYAKHRVTAEVETAFEQIRKQGGKASYGKIAFDLPTRTITIEDIAVTPGKAPQAQIRIAAIKGTGVRQIDETRISADAVDITGLEVTLDQIGAAKLKVAYKIPHLVMRDYAGPVQAGQVPADSSMYRYVLGQYASVAASSLTAPTLTISFDSRAGRQRRGHLFRTGDPEPKARQDRRDEVGPRRDLGRREATRQDGQADG